MLEGEGFRDGEFRQIRYLRTKAFCLLFLDFPGAVRSNATRAKKAEKGRKGWEEPISHREGNLKPNFVTPSSVVTQVGAPLSELVSERAPSGP